MGNEKEVLYQLTSALEYAFKGEKKEASFISIKPPTMKQHRAASKLKQSVMTLVRTEYAPDDNKKSSTNTSVGKGDNEEVGDEDESEDDSEPTAEVILTLLFSSNHLDINVIFDQAKSLFIEGVALIDGEEKFNVRLFDKMSIDDFQNLVGEYIANFILA